VFIKIKNLNIHYKILGQGAPVVMIHGWGTNLKNLSSLTEVLAKSHQVFALDLPGLGLSTPPSKPWGTPEYAEVVAEFIHALKIKNPVLIGHSFGGKISLYLTAKKMVDTEKLILISSSGIRLKRRKKFDFLRVAYVFKVLKILTGLPILRLFFRGKFWQNKLAEYRNRLGSEDYKAASGVMRASLVKIVNEDFRKLLPLIHIPTLLLWGSKDPSVSLTVAEMMRDLIPKASLVVFPNTGHFPHFTNKDEAEARVLEFLECL